MKRNHYIALGLLIVMLIGVFVSCEASDINPSNPFETDSSQPDESAVSDEASSKSNASVIQLIEISEDESEESSKETSKEVSHETSKETSAETSVDVSDPNKLPEPVYNGGTVTIPDTTGGEFVNIRAVTSSAKNTLEVFGDIDPDDPETAAAMQEIADMMKKYTKTTGFFGYSLDGKRAVAFNCENEFFSACTVKTGFILYCCLAIDQGMADKDTVMYYKEKYYHGGSGYIKNCEYGTSFTLERLIYLALNVSDNIAYEMLTAYFGHDGYNQMITDLGCERLTLGRSIWSYSMNAHDLAIIWRELYFYFQSNSYMANLYQKATYNTKYNYGSKALSWNYNHKSGDSQASHPVINDGSIIWADEPYVFTILNSSMGDHADETIVATLAKIVDEKLIRSK